MTYTVKEFAELTGLTEHTIRYYTNENLLPCRRDSNNRRLFDDESLQWVQGIQNLRNFGIPLEKIREIGECWKSDKPEELQKRLDFFLEQREQAHKRLKEAQIVSDLFDLKVAECQQLLQQNSSEKDCES